MVGFSRRLPTVKCVAVCGLVILLCAAGLTACGDGGGSGEPTPMVASETEVDLGETIPTGDWEIAIARPPEKLLVMGTGDVVLRAEGIYVIVPIEATNLGEEMEIVPWEQVWVRDSQGREFDAGGVGIHAAYAIPRGIGFSYPVNPGESRDTIIVFDVPTDATGLRMTTDETEETLALGF